MQRTIILACFFSVAIANCFAQEYPIVHYTPKDGLVNSRVRSVKQDSKGRMLFITFGGLSIYDGTRFINYSQQDGLANDLVNDVAEAGPDSFLVATNTNQLNTLVKGRIGIFQTVDGFCPIVNRFLKSSEGDWYIIADEGLFMLKEKKIIHLPLINKEGIDIGKDLVRIVEWKNFLFLVPWSNINERLVIFDKREKKAITILTDRAISNITKDKNDHIWMSFFEGSKLLDTAKLKKGKIDFLPPPPGYSEVSRYNYLYSNATNDLFVYTHSQLMIFSSKHPHKPIIIRKDLLPLNLTDVFQDREGTIWMTSDGKGIFKIPGLDVQLLNNYFPGQSVYISDIHHQSDTTWLFNSAENTVLRYTRNEIQSFPLPGKTKTFSLIYPVRENLYLIKGKKLFYITRKDQAISYSKPQLIYTDSIGSLGTAVVDRNGAIIIIQMTESNFHLLVFKENKKLFEYPVGFNVEQLVLDKKGRLWIIGRNHQLQVFMAQPENSSQYLRLLKDLTNSLPAREPRAITIDKNYNVWVGTRFNGLYCLKFDDLKLQSTKQFTTKEGLTDNFIYSLGCDNDNVIWVGTQTGLDKIFLKNDQYIIGNVSKTNNFFQAIWKITIKNDSTVWGLTNEGTILKVTNSSPEVTLSPPPLLLTSLKVNGQSIDAPKENKLSYKQNNLVFYAAATSYIDEKSIQYSYLLKGSGNESWSVPSNSPVFNFINLPPGKYVLQIRSDFPELMYPTQYLSYSFNIHPPWWQTWWFRTIAGLLIIGFLIIGIRFYYNRKLEKHKIILEKQQAVELERNRIAADMHDDLGAGLTKLKYISDYILEKTESGEPVKSEVEKLKSFSSELVESMGEIIWAVGEKNNLLSNTLYYLRSYAVNYCEEHGLECDFQIPIDFNDRVLSGNTRRNIFLLLKESLHNIVKHAGARSVFIKTIVSEELELTIKDDGIGFPWDENINGNGLINMTKRAKELGGSIAFENENGATVLIQLPLNTNQSTIG